MRLPLNEITIEGLQAAYREGEGITTLVVPGLGATYEGLEATYAQGVFPRNPVLAFNFRGHKNGATPGVADLDEQILKQMTFEDEMQQLQTVASTIDGQYRILTYSHGGLVAGFSYLEGMISPTDMVWVAPLPSRKDWLDIRNEEYEQGRASKKRFGPYQEDFALSITEVDFRGDAREDLYDIAGIPIAAVHGVNDEYFYNPEDGRPWGQNDIQRFERNPEVTVFRIEKTGHILQGRSLVRAMGFLSKHYAQ